MRTKIMCVAISIALIVPPAQASSVVGATEYTQILNNIQLAASYVKHVEANVQLLMQYRTMIQNLIKMTPRALLDAAVQKLWKDENMRKVFSDLREVYVNGQSLAYSLKNLDASFKRSNPGYGKYSDLDYGKSYKDWSDNSFSAIQNATRTVISQTDDLENEGMMMQDLDDASKSADGALSAIQAGNQVGIAMIGQLQKLRVLQMSQMQAQNSYNLNKQNQESAKKEKVDKWVEKLNARKPAEPGDKKEWFK